MDIKKTILLLSTLTLTGCSTLGFDSGLNLGSTYAERQTGFTYVPIEPTNAKLECTFSNNAVSNCIRDMEKKFFLQALPDNSVRIATRRISGNADGSIGALGLSTGVAGSSYEVIIDFVNTQTVNIQFEGHWQGYTRNDDGTLGTKSEKVPMLDFPENTNKEQWKLVITDVFTNDKESAENFKPAVASKFDEELSSKLFNIPVYVGIGLRLKATVSVNKGKVDLSSLASIAAAVESEKATGTMSVQTLGVTGKTARGGLLLLDRIDDTTIQNSIQTLASIKAAIENDDTTITPRVLGFHNTIGADTNGVNLIHSFLAREPISIIVNPSQSIGGVAN